jgi:aspartate racemase
MKTIGLLGGMSWESTLPYYRLLNQETAARLGGLHSAKIVLWSVDFDEIATLQSEARWDDAGALLAACAQALERAGAEFIVLATNTMHKVAPAIEAAVAIPLLHIVDATAAAIRAAGLVRVGLLATRFTMEQPFVRERLARHGIEALVPGKPERDEVHRVIYEELCRGRIDDGSRNFYRRTMARLVDRGAQGIILGCTEIMLLVGATDTTVPVFDTTALHARAAVHFALAPP